MIDVRGPDDGSLAARLAAARAGAVRAGCLVVHVVTAFRAGHPEVSSSNTMFASIRDHGLLMEDDPRTAIAPEIKPSDSEVVVVKRRAEEFSGSDLNRCSGAGVRGQRRRDGNLLQLADGGSNRDRDRRSATVGAIRPAPVRRGCRHSVRPLQLCRADATRIQRASPKRYVKSVEPPSPPSPSPSEEHSS
jgi:hypothetical protein